MSKFQDKKAAREADKPKPLAETHPGTPHPEGISRHEAALRNQAAKMAAQRAQKARKAPKAPAAAAPGKTPEPPM